MPATEARRAFFRCPGAANVHPDEQVMSLLKAPESPSNPEPFAPSTQPRLCSYWVRYCKGRETMTFPFWVALVAICHALPVHKIISKIRKARSTNRQLHQPFPPTLQRWLSEAVHPPE